MQKLIGVAMIFAVAWLAYMYASAPEKNMLGMTVVMNEYKPLPTQAEVDAANDAALRWKVFWWGIVLIMLTAGMGASLRFLMIPAINAWGEFNVGENGLPKPRARNAGSMVETINPFKPPKTIIQNPTRLMDGATGLYWNGEFQSHTSYGNIIDPADQVHIAEREIQAGVLSYTAHQGSRSRTSQADARERAGVFLAERKKKEAETELIKLRLQNYQQKALPAPVEPARHIITQNEAVALSNRNASIIGYTDDGRKCSIDIEASAHIAIVGASRTGKTSSVAMKIMLDCIRHGDHVVILDGMHGKELRPFAGWAEWHDSDGDIFRGQMERINQLFRQRELETDHKGRIVIFIEEFNEIWDDMTQEDQEAVERILKSMMRKARHASMHMVVIGQEPMGWPKTLVNIKTKIVFSLGIREASYVGEQNAMQLPDNGEFFCRRERFRAWLWEAEYQQFLPQKRETPLGTVINAETVGNAPETVRNGSETFPETPRFSLVETVSETETVETGRGGDAPEIPPPCAPTVSTVSTVSSVPEPLLRLWERTSDLDAIGEKFFQIFENGTQASLRQIMSQLAGKEPDSYKKRAHTLYHSYSPNRKG